MNTSPRKRAGTLVAFAVNVTVVFTASGIEDQVMPEPPPAVGSVTWIDADGEGGSVGSCTAGATEARPLVDDPVVGRVVGVVVRLPGGVVPVVVPAVAGVMSVLAAVVEGDDGVDGVPVARRVDPAGVVTDVTGSGAFVDVGVGVEATLVSSAWNENTVPADRPWAPLSSRSEMVMRTVASDDGASSAMPTPCSPDGWAAANCPSDPAKTNEVVIDAHEPADAAGPRSIRMSR